MTLAPGTQTPALEAIVLAGGFGTRLRAVVADVPKPMAPVAGRPFLEHVLRGLAAQGVPRVVLSVGYLHEQIVAHFGPHFEGMAVDYEIESSPLGTGGAIAAALKAEKLLLLTDTSGVMNEGKTLTRLTPADVSKLKEQAVISGGMIPKTDCAVAAVENGVNAAHIIDGRVPHALLLEIFTDTGVGTMILR